MNLFEYLSTAAVALKSLLGHLTPAADWINDRFDLGPALTHVVNSFDHKASKVQLFRRDEDAKKENNAWIKINK